MLASETMLATCSRLLPYARIRGRPPWVKRGQPSGHRSSDASMTWSRISRRDSARAPFFGDKLAGLTRSARQPRSLSRRTAIHLVQARTLAHLGIC